jgi:hypothetical protein
LLEAGPVFVEAMQDGGGHSVRGRVLHDGLRSTQVPSIADLAAEGETTMVALAVAK